MFINPMWHDDSQRIGKRKCTRIGYGTLVDRNFRVPYIQVFLELVVDTITLYRPVGPKALELIEAAGWRAFPPRLPEQPIFYPVLNEEYATQIARDWNTKESGSGFVTRFRVNAEFARRYPIQTVGGSIHQELWVPAEELEVFNRNIVGPIEVIAEFHAGAGADPSGGAAGGR